MKTFYLFYAIFSVFPSLFFLFSYIFFILFPSCQFKPLNVLTERDHNGIGIEVNLTFYWYLTSLQMGFNSLLLFRERCFDSSQMFGLWCESPSQKSRGTICPTSSDPYYIVTYYIEWVTTSWTHSMYKFHMTNNAIFT